MGFIMEKSKVNAVFDQIEIDSFIKNTPFPFGYEGVFQDIMGKSLTADQALTFLVIERAKGVQYLMTAPKRHHNSDSLKA